MPADPHMHPLATVEWLSRRLSDPDLLVVDIRSAESGGRRGFEAGHVPGAIHSDYAADPWRVARDGAGGLLPEPEQLAALLGRLGLVPDHHAVIVSAGLAPADFSAAARVYWTLKVAGHDRVSILDGGFQAWTEAGGPIERGPAQAAGGPPYPLRMAEPLRANTSHVTEAIAGGGPALLDGRSQAQFEGLDKSPVAARAGRLPGALHLDHARAFEPGTGRLRSAGELETLFAPLPAGPMVSYCNTGHLASTNWFILSEVLRRPGISLYDASMSGWTADPARPVATGPGQAH